MKTRDNYTFLTEGPIWKVVLTMAVPTTISMLVTSLYNLVDTYYVGRIDTQATAAVGVVLPVMTVIQAFGFFFGQGSGTFMARMLGAKESARAARMATSAAALSALFGLLLAVSGLLFLEPLSLLLGSTPTILPYTKDFLGIILLGAPFMTFALTLNNQIRFQGNAAYSMIGILSGAVLNVLTVPLFAFTLGMGIKGAAIGTVIGQICSALVLAYMAGKGGGVGLRLKDFAPDAGILRDIFRGGTPSLTRQGMASVSTLLLNVAAGAFGDAAIAGMSIVSRISLLVFSMILGLGQGFQPFCGFNYGAGFYRRVRRGYFFCLKAGTAVLLLCCIPGFIFAPEIIDFMRHDPSVVAVGGSALRWQLLTWPLAAVITFSNMTLQTSGRSVPANVLAASRNGIFFIPLIIVLPKLWGLFGVEICQAVSDVFSFAVAVFLMRSYLRSIGGGRR